MSLGCALVNATWFASCLPGARQFRSALRNPRAAQRRILRRLLQINSGSAFGREHDFAACNTYEDFSECVPIRSYEEIAPWIDRIRDGEQSVLTTDPVTQLIPTSGSTSAQKLIPFTRQLQKEFDAAIAPWVAELFCEEPTLIGGPAYWSISPKAQLEELESAVPIGFGTDAEYLGGVRARMIEGVMVRPPAAALNGGMADFRVETLTALVRARDLRMISVWHPSFLTLLLDELPNVWRRLLKNEPKAKLPPEVPSDLRELWPQLKLISCWGDGHAEIGTREIQARFPGVKVQSKGLLATEGCVSLPLDDEHPLAINSHFFEFLGDSNNVLRADQLREGSTYEVVLTTGGGLWRYKLGDRVRVKGFVSETPSIQFVSRSGQVSDLRGEKLAEAFVADCIRRIDGNLRFAMLAPSLERGRAYYSLIIEGDIQPNCGEQLDQLLSSNIHYREARELGQLGPIETHHVRRNAYSIYTEHLVRSGQTLGNIKPVALAKELYWEEVFAATNPPTETAQ